MIREVQIWVIIWIRKNWEEVSKSITYDNLMKDAKEVVDYLLKSAKSIVFVE